MVKLSVIVPFYNVRQYAPDALRSLRANVRADFEFILVDDCSTDGTGEIVERAAHDLPGAVHVRREEKGVSAARNQAMGLARGEYVTFMDADDWVAPGYFSRLVGAIEELGCDFVRTDHVRCTGNAREIQRVPFGPRNVVVDPRDVILPSDRSTPVDYPYSWAGVYHRRLVDEGLLLFPEHLRTAEDRPWIWRLHREAKSFAAVDLLGIFYRRGVTTSLTQIGDTRQLDFIPAFDQVVEETSQDPEADRFLPKVIRTYCAIIAHHLNTIEKFEPAVARKLRAQSSAALKRMPQDLLKEALDSMDHERAARLRRLRRRPVGAEVAA
ncbi:glycosyltransferase family 2 protein [Streptomyces sp. MUM 203J]|uniref:glycosyltransferase family 2 protein n=1 Tax=Streptomyces sp. MUM 203J TaxID=2791990 RepID=UPI001F04FC92|nr:glycosyltransferase family 2 protein [Streptomyces sp. MUM 203J]MCH0539377.1 glycosyltransferase family 2 protein [Streptomyces sp. MUM 203J]